MSYRLQNIPITTYQLQAVWGCYSVFLDVRGCRHLEGASWKSPDSCTRLAVHISGSADVLTQRYVMRSLPNQPPAYGYWPWQETVFGLRQCREQHKFEHRSRMTWNLSLRKPRKPTWNYSVRDFGGPSKSSNFDAPLDYQPLPPATEHHSSWLGIFEKKMPRFSQVTTSYDQSASDPTMDERRDGAWD
ncbi:uncharacterized protein CLUP02_04976 [Colletotrichum lupini]|uniref:Uncharacterized protein n=1 Tax=Colletotrichum lupini TaxID=145971 RepID=A0A9Q8SMF3_9PEZI|nr:uncharacterized protein CLUP02_04976 [Colletotrichum lupini]UQC79496.1 hypothetical protein CLUP02_04976 [Colletotrichum lupini]